MTPGEFHDFVEKHKGKEVRLKRSFDKKYVEGTLVDGRVKHYNMYFAHDIFYVKIQERDMAYEYVLDDPTTLSLVNYKFHSDEEKSGLYEELDYEELSELFYKPLTDDEWLEFFKILYES